MRSIALDVHRDFCEVAIKEGGEVRSSGRVRTSDEEFELFARSLAKDDQVALEATGPANAIVRVLEPHVARVVVANTRRVRAIAEAKVKTDKVDAATLCELLDAGFLPAVWSPDESTRALRGLLGRRDRLVRSRTRAKNAVHAALQRNLKGRPPMSDVFGRVGRRWLGRLELPAHERQIVESCLREVDFLSHEIAALESELAKLALSSEAVKRLMSVPGVSLVSAATFVAVVGDIRRFESPKRLVGYVGLDPKVRQSGEQAARHGRISKQGSAAARHMLCEAAWSADRARRHGAKALRAVLAPAHARAGLRLRATLTHPAQAQPARAHGRRSAAARPALWLWGEQARAAPRARALRTVRAGLPQARRGLAAEAEEKWCGRDTGTRILKASIKSQAARQGQVPDPAL